MGAVVGALVAASVGVGAEGVWPADGGAVGAGVSPGKVAVDVGVTVTVGVAVGGDVAVAVRVGVAVSVGVEVIVGVALGVAVIVGDGVSVEVAVGVAVEVAVAVAVGVGVGCCRRMPCAQMPSSPALNNRSRLRTSIASAAID